MDNLNTDVRFSIVPQWLLETSISDRAIRIYALIAGYADNETLTAFPSRETLAKRAGCHVKTVDRAIAELVELGAVSKTQRMNGDAYSSNLYTLRRVAPHKSPPRDTHVQGVGTPVSPPRDTTVPLTRTNELEPINDNHLTKPKPKNADDYQPSPDLLEKLTVDFPGIRLDIELEKFRDHHVANGSQFKIWDRAFRKWVRQASEWSPEARAARSMAIEDEKIRKMIEEGLE
jgi:hypothetical protein